GQLRLLRRAEADEDAAWTRRLNSAPIFRSSPMTLLEPGAEIRMVTAAAEPARIAATAVSRAGLLRNGRHSPPRGSADSISTNRRTAVHWEVQTPLRILKSTSGADARFPRRMTRIPISTAIRKV